MLTGARRARLTAVKRRSPQVARRFLYSAGMLPFAPVPCPSLRIARAVVGSCLALALAAYGVTGLAADTRVSRINFTLEGSVLDVDDGDTLVLRGVGGGRFTIRLSDLDAPEVEHARNPYRDRRACRNAPRRALGQDQGEAARTALRQRAPRKAAARAECYTIDHYGRPVCHVFVAGANLNLAQLRDGWGMLPGKRAWQRDPDSATAEQAARGGRRGLWAEARPEPPASWRTRCWCRGECTPRTH